MHNGLWGHAMMLASKMDKKVTNDVTTRYKINCFKFHSLGNIYTCQFFYKFFLT